MTCHAELGASRAERWMHCPGSVRMARAVPDVDTPYAAEGRKAHAYAERMLLNHAGEWAAADAEMLEHVRTYVEYVRRLHRESEERTGPGGAFLRVEVTFNLAPIQPHGADPMFGTADAVITGGRRLDVVDFKYGAGVPVEVNGNAQLLYYVLGALVSLQPASPDTPMMVEDSLSLVDDIWVHIVQPRVPHADGPIRTAHVSHDEVRAFAKDLMVKAALTQDPTAPLVPGTWCKFCPAQAFCPAVKRYAIELAQRDFTVVEPPAAETLPIEVVASVLTKVDVLEHWVASLKARVVAELEAGRAVPGWKLVTKRPRRVWNDAQGVENWAANISLELLADIHEQTLKSPAQVEEIVGKKNLPAELYSLVSSGTTLAPEYDRRPAVVKGPQEEFTALPPAAADQSGGDIA